MATATKKTRMADSSPAHQAERGNPILHALDAIYRFLASLKLAVISLSSLAAVLAYATFFESWYGTAAAQEWIYRSKGFSVLLAFLGANILCAALIRYPWKKRQTGFVVTHLGLLVLLGGSFYSLMTSDEGQLALLEGETKSEMIRSDYPIVRVRQIDPQKPSDVLREWELPFHPGTFGWGPGQPRPRNFLNAFDDLFSKEDAGKPRDVLTQPKDPFQFVVKSHMPASIPAVIHRADPDGSPMAKIRPTFKAPGMPKGRDVFPSEPDRWFETDKRFYRIVKSRDGSGDPMPAQFAFLYTDRPELVEDFLNPAESKGDQGTARFHYVDKSGKSRTYDFALDGQEGKSFSLPDSEFEITFVSVASFPAREAGLSDVLGVTTIPIAKFEVKKGTGASLTHLAMASLPMFPNVIPPADPDSKSPPARALVSINYDLPPALDPKSNGRFGLVEVLGTPDGTLYYRVFGRGDAGKTRGQIRSKGKVTKETEIVAFGGNANMPMTIAFSVEDYMTSGVEENICEPIVLPAGKKDEGLAASLVEMTVNDPDHGHNETKTFYLRRSATYEPVWETVSFPHGVYQIAYDVEHKPLGFDLKLVDFQRGFDPGTEQAARFSSDVKLTDKAMGINDKAYHIAMNEPLNHRGYKFYQSRYVPDPETGRMLSILQVGKDPGRILKYTGSLLICLGAFLQFYMRAGLFTDGGKRERDLAAKKAGANEVPTQTAEVAPPEASKPAMTEDIL